MYKMFDFFGNCEFFEEEYDYDQIIELPPEYKGKRERGGVIISKEYENFDPDAIKAIIRRQIDYRGMKIDRMFFENFEDCVSKDETIKSFVQDENWDKVIEYLKKNVLDKPEEYYTIEKLRKAAGVDRRLQLREIIEKALGIIPKFKTKDEMLEEEFQKFISDRKPDDHNTIVPMKYFFKAYTINTAIRHIIDNGRYAELYVNPTFNMTDYEAVPKEWREVIPEYIKDYVPLNQFMT